MITPATASRMTTPLLAGWSGGASTTLVFCGGSSANRGLPSSSQKCSVSGKMELHCGQRIIPMPLSTVWGQLRRYFFELSLRHYAYVPLCPCASVLKNELRQVSL